MVERFTLPTERDGDESVRYSDYAELEAEVERLTRERDDALMVKREAIAGWRDAEALSRTGAVKVPSGEIEEIVSDLEYWSERLADMRQPQGQSSLKHAASILSALEPAAPEAIAKGLLSDADAKAAKLGKFGHHPDPAIDFEIEVETLQARLIDAKGGISKPGTEPEAVAAVLEDIERAMTFRVGGDPSAVRAKQTLRDLEADAKQAGQPAAPGGRQDDEPRAYIVHAPEDDYYGTGPDRLQFHPLAQHDLDNGYRQTPLYGRPAHELSGNTGELIDRMAEAIRGDTTSDDTPWATLSEDRKEGWRGDAERALAVVKEHLTARLPAPEGHQDDEPVAWQWRAYEDGGAVTDWHNWDWGDRRGWEALAKRDPGKYEVRSRPLYTRPAEQAVTYSDEAMLEMASDAYRRGVDRSSFAQAAEWAFDEAKDDALTAALAQKEGGR